MSTTEMFFLQKTYFCRPVVHRCTRRHIVDAKNSEIYTTCRTDDMSSAPLFLMQHRRFDVLEKYLGVHLSMAYTVPFPSLTQSSSKHSTVETVHGCQDDVHFQLGGQTASVIHYKFLVTSRDKRVFSDIVSHRVSPVLNAGSSNSPLLY